MTQELTILLVTAAALGFFHTLFGPDHYLPFIVMARARKWSALKTAAITALSGVGHIASSVVLGLAGITLGLAVTKLERFESLRGAWAAWALIAFGLVYFIWGLRRAIRNKPHEHLHSHGSDGNHLHPHSHTEEHLHPHEKEKETALTPWVLFTIFLFGPCEPLIPMLMYPAARNSRIGVLMVAAVFGTVTISTMLGVVMLSYSGIKLIPAGRFERYTHALAGAAIFFCGLAIQFLGL